MNPELEFVKLIVQFFVGSGNVSFTGEKLCRNSSLKSEFCGVMKGLRMFSSGYS